MIYLKRVSICVVRRHSFLVASHLISDVTFYLWRHIYMCRHSSFVYQTSHLSLGFMGVPTGHPKTSENSFVLDKTPITRNLAGEWESSRIWSWLAWGVEVEHQTWKWSNKSLFNIFWRNQRVYLAKIKIILNINLNSKTEPLPRVSQCVSIDGLESPLPQVGDYLELGWGDGGGSKTLFRFLLQLLWKRFMKKSGGPMPNLLTPVCSSVFASQS